MTATWGGCGEWGSIWGLQSLGQVRPNDCNLGKLRRTINYLYIDEDDEYVYAGALYTMRFTPCTLHHDARTRSARVP
jgi:hypothetical protein